MAMAAAGSRHAQRTWGTLAVAVAVAAGSALCAHAGKARASLAPPAATRDAPTPCTTPAHRARAARVVARLMLEEYAMLAAGFAEAERYSRTHREEVEGLRRPARRDLIPA